MKFKSSAYGREREYKVIQVIIIHNHLFACHFSTVAFVLALM